MDIHPTLLIRADAGPSIGSGHLMRCSALAEAWVEAGGRVHFRSRTGSPALDSRLAEIGGLSAPAGAAGSPEDAESTAVAAERLGAAWVVLDGYSFRTEFEASLADRGCRALIIDDLADRTAYCSAALLNQNAYAGPALYRDALVPPLMLLGPRFALLRREFREQRKASSPRGDSVRRILITAGGADAQGLSAKALGALRLLGRKDLDVVLVVGPNNQSLGELQELADAAECPIRIEVAVSNMASLMAEADLVIQGAGSTVWEACCMGLPSILASLADNQRRVAEAARAAGACESLGWHASFNAEQLAEAVARLIKDAPRRAAMGEAGQALVDGLGAMRVRDALLAWET